MIPHTTKLLHNQILMFVMVLQIIFSQMLVTTGFIAPQIDTIKNKLCILETVNNQQSNDLKSLSINETIKEAYNYCNDELKNFNKIPNFIEKQPTKDIKDLAYNVLYQEVLDHYTLEKSEKNQMHLCLLEIILERKQEAIGHFKDLNPSSVSQVIKYAFNFQNGTHLSELVRFIINKSEVSNIEHNILILTLENYTHKQLQSGKRCTFVLFFGGSKLIEVGVKLHSTKMESFYFNKLQELWGDIMGSYCSKGQYKPVTFSKLKDLPSHLHEMDGKFDKVEHYFLDILVPAVRKVLNKKGVENKFDMILKCVTNSFPFIEPGAILYSTVFDEITKQNLTNTNNFITKFAYYIKNYMELPNYSHIDEKYKEVFENLKRNIPDWAQKLIWNGDNCKLKNRKWDQYLTSACGSMCNIHNTTSVESCMIFVEQIDDIQENADVQSQWKFETKNQGTSFTIANIGSDKYLASNVVDENGQPVYTPINPNVEPLWNITSSVNGNFVTLQNTHNNAYLSVGDPCKNDPLKRKVITQKLGSPTQEILQESEWKLICA